MREQVVLRTHLTGVIQVNPTQIHGRDFQNACHGLAVIFIKNEWR